jgi:hypothetical protein
MWKLQPIDQPLFWALIAVAVGLIFGALISTGVFDQLFTSGNIPQPAAALIGAFIGGGFALSGVVLTDWLNRRRAHAHEVVVNRRYLRAVRDELETVWKSYSDDIGTDVEALQPDQRLDYHYPIFEDLLPVYHGNIATILNLEDHELRKQIVVTCTSFMTLMDCFRFHNSMLVECEDAEARQRFGPDGDLKLADEVARCQKRIVDYTLTIRAAHIDVKANLEKLIASIERALIA